MLVLDGAYLVGPEPPVVRRIAPPGEAELQALVEQMAERIGGRSSISMLTMDSRHHHDHHHDD